MGSLLSVLREW
jgi:hypothetical protein